MFASQFYFCAAKGFPLFVVSLLLYLAVALWSTGPEVFALCAHVIRDFAQQTSGLEASAIKATGNL